MESETKAQPEIYFHNAVVEWRGNVFHFSIADGQAIESPAYYWHGPGDPSTSLAMAIFCAARERVGEAGTDIALELGGMALGITAEKLRSSIEWFEAYMRFHDGDYESPSILDE